MVMPYGQSDIHWDVSCWCPPTGNDAVFLRNDAVFLLYQEYSGELYDCWCPGPCLTIATWCCHKNFSQWQHSFLWKLRCHWLKGLRQRQIAACGCQVIIDHAIQYAVYIDPCPPQGKISNMSFQCLSNYRNFNKFLCFLKNVQCGND